MDSRQRALFSEAERTPTSHESNGIEYNYCHECHEGMRAYLPYLPMYDDNMELGYQGKPKYPDGLMWPRCPHTPDIIKKLIRRNSDHESYIENSMRDRPGGSRRFFGS